MNYNLVFLKKDGSEWEFMTKTGLHKCAYMFSASSSIQVLTFDICIMSNVMDACNNGLSIKVCDTDYVDWANSLEIGKYVQVSFPITTKYEPELKQDLLVTWITTKPVHFKIKNVKLE